MFHRNEKYACGYRTLQIDANIQQINSSAGFSMVLRMLKPLDERGNAWRKTALSQFTFKIGQQYLLKNSTTKHLHNLIYRIISLRYKSIAGNTGNNTIHPCIDRRCTRNSDSSQQFGVWVDKPWPLLPESDHRAHLFGFYVGAFFAGSLITSIDRTVWLV